LTTPPSVRETRLAQSSAASKARHNSCQPTSKKVAVLSGAVQYGAFRSITSLKPFNWTILFVLAAADPCDLLPEITFGSDNASLFDVVYEGKREKTSSTHGGIHSSLTNLTRFPISFGKQGDSLGRCCCPTGYWKNLLSPLRPKEPYETVGMQRHTSVFIIKSSGLA
jgi:hypothetical protein